MRVSHSQRLSNAMAQLSKISSRGITDSPADEADRHVLQAAVSGPVSEAHNKN